MRIRTRAAAIYLAGIMAGLWGGSAMAQGMRPGGDPPDAHGCAASTGMTYSVLKRSCIQVWSAGIQLLPLKPQGTATYNADVVFAHGHDGHWAELFLYDHKGSVMLEKVGAFWSGRWAGQGYSLTRQNGVYSLTGPDGQVIYDSANR